jgi:hypothetical protein
VGGWDEGQEVVGWERHFCRVVNSWIGEKRSGVFGMFLGQEVTEEIVMNTAERILYRIFFVSDDARVGCAGLELPRMLRLRRRS